MPDIELRRQVGGKIYDTQTAKFITTLVYRIDGDNWNNEYTQLFITKRGAFFIAGYGGSMSRWKRKARDGNGWVAGDGLTPIDVHEARRLMEEFSPDIAEYYFCNTEA